MSKDIDEIAEERARIAAIGSRSAAISQPASLHLSLPKFDLPRLELPQLAAIGADIEAASERWREAMAPLTAVGERFRRQMEAMQATLAPLAEQLKWIEDQERQCERLERAGWLPHKSSPFDMLKSNAIDDADVDSAVAEYYARNWPAVSATLRSEIDGCSLDDEARECFAEAVAAHGAGLYRCAPRLLFPEIERVARLELHGGELDRITNQDKLVQAIGSLTPAEMASTGVTGLRFYKKLTEHLYRHLKDADRVAAAKADPVPNRHAAVHGIISYTSAKSSLNALLVADYLLQAISTIKRLAREDISVDRKDDSLDSAEA
jgi:hypothetical protein